MNKLPSQPNQSLIDGLTVLQALTAADRPVACAQLARELGLEVTRVNRLLKTLDYLGLAHRTPSSKYQAGPGMHVLAAQSLFSSGLLHSAGSTLEALTTHGFVVALGVLWRDSVAYLFHWNTGISMTEAVGRIALYPATRSSIGLALLARQSDEEIAALYHDSIPGFVDRAALLRELAAIRSRGYAELPAVGDSAHRNLAMGIGSPAYAALAVTEIPLEQRSTMLSYLIDAVATINATYDAQHSTEIP